MPVLVSVPIHIAVPVPLPFPVPVPVPVPIPVPIPDSGFRLFQTPRAMGRSKTTIHGCNLLILGDSRRSMADFARIIQRSSIGYSSPSLCLGRSRIPPKFPFTTNSEIWFSRLNVMSRSLSLCALAILRWNADFLCLRGSLIQYISSSSVGSAILDLVKLNPRLCAAKLKVDPISTNNFQA